MTNIDTIKEALRISSNFFKSFMDGPREGQMNDALAALSTIEADAKPQEPSEEVMDIVQDIQARTTHDGGDIMHLSWTEAAARITARDAKRDDAIRRESSGRLNIAIAALEKLACLGAGPYYGNSIGNVIAQDALKTVMAVNDLHAAILDTEPAREDS